MLLIIAICVISWRKKSFLTLHQRDECWKYHIVFVCLSRVTLPLPKGDNFYFFPSHSLIAFKCKLLQRPDVHLINISDCSASPPSVAVLQLCHMFQMSFLMFTWWESQTLKYCCVHEEILQYFNICVMKVVVLCCGFYFIDEKGAR